MTHLIESGIDALFVQQRVGYAHASTTALYAGVTGDYRVRILRRVLDSTVKDALAGIEPKET